MNRNTENNDDHLLKALANAVRPNNLCGRKHGLFSRRLIANGMLRPFADNGRLQKRSLKASRNAFRLLIR